MKTLNSLETLSKAISKLRRLSWNSGEFGALAYVQQSELVSFLVARVEKRVNYHLAVALHVDNWLPACNGTETPYYTRSGRRVLYCWNPATGEHGYIDMNSDILMTQSEFEAASR